MDTIIYACIFYIIVPVYSYFICTYTYNYVTYHYSSCIMKQLDINSPLIHVSAHEIYFHGDLF